MWGREIRRERADASPGSTVGACTKEASFALVAKAINKVHEDVPEVITVIENMVSRAFPHLPTLTRLPLTSLAALSTSESKT